jgi:hypothetical protein
MIFVQDGKKGYRKVTATEFKKMLASAYRQICSATDYTDGYLKHGSACDSSDEAAFRAAYVVKAEERFVNDHIGDILAAAAELVLRDIHSLEKKDD